MKRRPIKLGIAALAALGMLLPLSACEGKLPEASGSTTEMESAPDLTEQQEKQIRANLLQIINECNNDKKTDRLAEAMSGPELQIRTSEIQIAQKTNKLDPKTKIPDDITQTIIPTDNGWPRSIFTITTTTDDQQSKRLLVFSQDSARTNYKLWGLARLFQGAKLPKFAVPTVGSKMGKSNDLGLKMSPLQAVERYADVLQNGANSKYANDFADDYFRQDLAKISQNVQEGMERNKGTQQQTFTAVPDQMRVMQSAEGGDLVVAQIDSVWTRTAGEGRESQPASDAERALFGDGKATSTMQVTYVNVIAMYVPPKDSKQPVTAIGAERQPIKVEAK